jgi:hypothetical protein
MIICAFDVCEVCEGRDREVSVLDIREGTRRAKVMSGYGSIEMEVNEERVAP